VLKQIVVITEAYHFCQLHTKFYPTSCCQGPYAEEIISGDFDGTSQLLIIYILHSSYIWKKMGIQFSSVSAIYRLQ